MVWQFLASVTYLVGQIYIDALEVAEELEKGDAARTANLDIGPIHFPTLQIWALPVTVQWPENVDVRQRGH